MKEVLFLSLSRLITKDQIKKGSFQLSIGTGSSYSDPFNGGVLTLTDAQASDTGGTNPVQGGDYGVLYTSSVGINANSGVGNIFYQAGIVVLTASVFGGSSQMDSSGNTMEQLLTGSTINASCDAIRHRISNLTFNNTTEINSKIYFCRAPFNRFNYSANPTYTSGSKIVTKNVAADTPVAYITQLDRDWETFLVTILEPEVNVGVAL